MGVVDTINRKYGNSTIKLAVEGVKNDWKMKRVLLSNRYTTSWDQLLEVY
jgi:DNA polymerase V